MQEPGSPHAQLVEGVLKDVLPPHADAKGAVVALLGRDGPHTCPEEGALVVKVDQAGGPQEGRQGALQQGRAVPQ